MISQIRDGAIRRLGATRQAWAATDTGSATVRERLGALLKGRPATALRLLRVLLIALLVAQVLRAAVPAVRAELLLRAATAQVEDQSREKTRDPLEKYNAILEKGVLGVPPKEQPPQLFGILGDVALIGGAPEQVQEYKEGADLPSGEKVVRVGVDSVELEKDGEKQTLEIFPELKKQ